MTDWQPITTAPKPLKPRKIDLWIDDGGDGYRVPDAFWSGGLWKITTQVGFDIRAYSAQHTATHWMARPEPPEANA